VALIYAGTNGYLDEVPLAAITSFGQTLEEYLTIKDLSFFNLVKESKKLAPDSESLLKEAIASVIKEINV
jgi:F-type H+-transporting ATPase subunit alpha